MTLRHAPLTDSDAAGSRPRAQSAGQSAGQSTTGVATSTLPAPGAIHLARHSTMPQPLPAEVTNRSGARKLEVERVTHWEDLVHESSCWDELAGAAIEPNVFYSSFAVLAAMRHLTPSGEPEFLIVRGFDSGAPKAAAVWCGFLPLMKSPRYQSIPAGTLRFLKHDYCFLCAPLIRKDCARETLRALTDWLDNARISILEWTDQPGDGPYAELLTAYFHARGNQPWLSGSHVRALLRPASDEETYIRTTLSGGRIKELRRRERRLADLGEVQYICAADPRSLATWIDEFLQLERAGWKGVEQTAIASKEAHRRFFLEFAQQAAGRGQLRILALLLDGRPIAIKCNVLAYPGSFAFKITFAEEFAKYSPGQLLEIENIRRVHGETGIEWMDSCADPMHPMIDSLWGQRRTIRTWVAPVGRWGRFVVAALPLLRWLKRALRPAQTITENAP